MGDMFRPFTPKQDVPIIGQPFTVRSGFPTTLLQCNCEAREPVMLVGAAPGQCRACRRTFVCAGFTFNGQTGQIQVQVGLLNQPDPIPEPVGATS